MENILQTILLKPVYEMEEVNPKFKSTLNAYIKKLEDIASDYVDYCIDNNIEMYSAEGWFHQAACAVITKNVVMKGHKLRVSKGKRA